MNIDRYAELQGPDGKLTEAEIADGWFYCICEWDGLLLQTAKGTR